MALVLWVKTYSVQLTGIFVISSCDNDGGGIYFKNWRRTIWYGSSALTIVIEIVSRLIVVKHILANTPCHRHRLAILVLDHNFAAVTGDTCKFLLDFFLEFCNAFPFISSVLFFGSTLSARGHQKNGKADFPQPSLFVHWCSMKHKSANDGK
jgi:hypothetical protein